MSKMQDLKTYKLANLTTWFHYLIYGFDAHYKFILQINHFRCEASYNCNDAQ